jgi:hypothetical protein
LIWRYYSDQNRKLNLTGDLAEEMKENDYYEENFIYQSIMKYLFNQENTTICKPEELLNLEYKDLIRYYK